MAPQAWPALRNIPKIAARAAASTSASSKITYGALPPSSRLTRFTSMPAWAPIILPVLVSPVKEILSTFLLVMISEPTMFPGPGTRLSTPLGRPVWCMSLTSS